MYRLSNKSELYNWGGGVK